MRNIVPAAALLALVAACASQANRLPSRVVDDPIVLPARMGAVSLAPYKEWYPRTGHSADGFNALDLRIALTDHVELDDLFSLRVAFLNDAPGRPTPPLPISLAVQAGLTGFGYSSLEGYILAPVVSLQVEKHLAGRWRFAASTSWTARWAQQPVELMTVDGAPLMTARRWSRTVLDGGVTRQLTTRFAARVGGSLFEYQDCAAPTCDWLARGAGVGASVFFRPWRWLTLRAGSGAGLLYRPRVLDPPQSPVLPVDTPDRRTTWVTLNGTATFYW